MIPKEIKTLTKTDSVTLNNLNFDTIDCSDSMKNFAHKMRFMKTTGFKGVEKMQVSN